MILAKLRTYADTVIVFNDQSHELSHCSVKTGRCDFSVMSAREWCLRRTLVCNMIGPMYSALEELRMNASKKRRQLIALRNAVTDFTLRTHFGVEVLILRSIAIP